MPNQTLVMTPSLFVYDAAHAQAIAAAFTQAADLLLTPPAGEAATPLPHDVSGDLDAIPANRIGEPAPLPASTS